MIQKIKVPVSVDLCFDHRQRRVFPKNIFWEGRDYPILKIGLHHTYREGKTLFHVFSVVSKNLFFRLNLNTDNLFWTLEEIADGLPN